MAKKGFRNRSRRRKKTQRGGEPEPEPEPDTVKTPDERISNLEKKQELLHELGQQRADRISDLEKKWKSLADASVLILEGDGKRQIFENSISDDLTMLKSKIGVMEGMIKRMKESE